MACQPLQVSKSCLRYSPFTESLALGQLEVEARQFTVLSAAVVAAEPLACMEGSGQPLLHSRHPPRGRLLNMGNTVD